ncbi:MAG: hypothetical protein NC080_03870 [Paraprevotella sp.]|nr:hypothetical protein [Paraprevotella sp.]
MAEMPATREWAQKNVSSRIREYSVQWLRGASNGRRTAKDKLPMAALGVKEAGGKSLA